MKRTNRLLAASRTVSGRIGMLVCLSLIILLLEEAVTGVCLVTVAVPTTDAERIHYNITSGLEAMYQGDFENAIATFSTQIQEYPDDPKAYFFLAITYRWMNRIDPENETYQQQFEDAMAASVKRCQSLLKQDAKNSDATLYLAASYGYRAEYYNFSKFDWSKAYDNGVKMRDYLDKSAKMPNISIDAQLGFALYNYYAYLYRDKIGKWRFLLSLPKGDREKGIAMLEQLREQGIYSKIEAWFFLIEIYKEENRSKDQAIALNKALHEKFPNNPYFHTLLAGTHHKFQEWDHSRRIAQEIITNAQSHTPYYSDYLAYQAKYLLGESAYFLGKYQEALPFFDEIIAKQPGNPAYLIPWSHLRRGAIYNLTGDKEKAKAELQFVLKMKDVHHVHDFAEALLKSQQKASK